MHWGGLRDRNLVMRFDILFVTSHYLKADGFKEENNWIKI